MSSVPFASKTERYILTHKLIGVYLPKKEASYLQLYATYKETSVSNILREIIGDFLKDKEDNDIITKGMAEKTYDEWNEWCTKNAGKAGWRGAEQIALRWEEFIAVALSNLKKKKLNPDIITEIVQLIEKMEINHD